MALDPMIARGVAPIDVTNTLAQVAALRQRDQSLQQDASANALMRERFDYGRQQDQAAAQQGEEDDAEWDAAYQAKDWGAMARIDPQTTKILWDQEQAAQPKAPEFRSVGNSLLQLPTEAGADPRVVYTAPPTEPRPAEESFSPQVLADGSIALVGNRGTIRPTNLKGPTKTDPVKTAADTKKASAESAWNMYSTAMDGVRKAMENTTTGPILGRVPAFSAAQQTADGAVAAIAPVLKQLFRTAGEGTFTDKDQQLLLAMVPTRADRAEARDAKIANIDAIVSAKLGKAAPGNGGGSPPADRLKEGVNTTFGNGQTWTLKGGKAVRVK
jgi:hypothetical protein